MRRWSLWSSKTATGAGNSSRLVRAATVVHRAGGVVVGGEDGVQAVGGRVFGAAVHLVDDGGFLRCAGCATLGRRSVPIPERLVPALKARLDGRSPDAQIS